MGALTRTLHAVAEQRADTVQTFALKDWLGRIVGPGAPITPTSAMKTAAVFACIRVLAEGVSALPIHTYRRLAQGAMRDTSFYLYRLLHDEPNPEMSAVTFIETLQAHAAGWGNGWAEIVRDNGNRPTALWPLRPDRMAVRREGSALIYRYLRPNGTTVDLSRDQIFHVPGLSFDGMVGYSVLADSQAVALAQAAEEFGTTFMRNNARPAIVAMHPKTLTAGAVERLATQFERLKGTGNAGKTIIMEEGLSLKEIGIPPEQAQYLETRRFQLGEIARLFRIPPHMIGDVERSTSWGTGIEAQNRQFLDQALGAWLRRWEQAINRTLITSAYRAEFYAEFNRDALLRGDTLSRYQAHHLALMDGWKNDDDVRAAENLNPKPDRAGQVYYKSRALIPEQLIDAEAEAEPEPEPSPDESDRTTDPDPVEVRCSGCNRLLAEAATAPYRIACHRCKTVNELAARSEEPRLPTALLP